LTNSPQASGVTIL